MATLRINFRGLKEEFTTENRDRPHERIDMKLVSGPFRSLEGGWRFIALSEAACKVELNLRYEFASSLLDKLVGAVFDEIANSLVDAFARRADERFGKPREPRSSSRWCSRPRDGRSLRRVPLPAGSTVGGRGRCERPGGGAPQPRPGARRNLRKGRSGKTVLRDGDRVEIYRPLQADPKDLRRARAAKKRAKA